MTSANSVMFGMSAVRMPKTIARTPRRATTHQFFTKATASTWRLSCMSNLLLPALEPPGHPAPRLLGALAGHLVEHGVGRARRLGGPAGGPPPRAPQRPAPP